MTTGSPSPRSPAPGPSPAPGALPPTFETRLTPAQTDRLSTLSTRFVQAVLKVAHRIALGDPRFPGMEALGLAPEHVALLRLRPPERPEDMLVIGRLDVTTDGVSQLSYELNGDQPGGLELVAALYRRFAPAVPGAPPPSAPAPPPSPVREPPHRPYVRNALALLEAQGGPAEPRGVLLLANGYHLIDVLRAELEDALGRPILCAADGSGCRFAEGTLSARDAQGGWVPIDLVFRSPRVNVYELVSPAYAPVRQAWEAGRVVIVNPPHSRIAGCKALYGLLSREALLDGAGVTEDEAEAVRRLLGTVALVDERVRARLLAHPADWVLKAPLGGKGAAVWLGPQTAPDLWREQVERAARAPGWTAWAYQPPFRLAIRPHDEPGRVLRSPTSIDPYVTIGPEPGVCGFLCRAVLPRTDEEEELAHAKLNLLGDDRYRDRAGREHRRTVGLGWVVHADPDPTT